MTYSIYWAVVSSEEITSPSAVSKILPRETGIQLRIIACFQQHFSTCLVYCRDFVWFIYVDEVTPPNGQSVSRAALHLCVETVTEWLQRLSPVREITTTVIDSDES